MISLRSISPLVLSDTGFDILYVTFVDQEEYNGKSPIEFVDSKSLLGFTCTDRKLFIEIFFNTIEINIK